MNFHFRKLSTILARAASIRSYYATTHTRTTLYSKISPLGDPKFNLLPELDNWIENGRRVSVAELQRIIHDFRKRKRFTQALQVSEWMNEKGVCIFSSAEYAVQLDLIGKVRGFEGAERYFSGLRDEDRNEKTYGALLNCFVRQSQADKALTLFGEMKEMGFASTLAYNSIIRLYNKLGQHEKGVEVLRDMVRNNVCPDNFSYRICLTAFGEKGDIDGMERILEEMEGQEGIVMDWGTYAAVANFYIEGNLMEKVIDALQKSESRLALDAGDGVAYNHLISLYAKIGKTSVVMRLWDLEKEACKRYLNRDYLTMLQSLVRLGEMEEAEKVLKDWEGSGNFYDARIPKTVINGYSEKGLHDKAKSLQDNLQKKAAESPKVAV